MSQILPRNGKVSWLFYFLSPSKLSSIIVPLLHTACLWNYEYISSCEDTLVHLFSKDHWYVYYVDKHLYVLVYTSVFILYEFLLCSVFVYHGYINVNIGPWWMGTWLNIFLSSKHTNKSFSWYHVLHKQLIKNIKKSIPRSFWTFSRSHFFSQFGLIWFLCFIAYQHLRVIQYFL